ncbi:MAG: DUF3987 domain-containing protein, partial [Burkholderiaceae bacterium]|nr:DUF3987 domain-containing protein [Burkholderiaceae bacterium]
MTHFQNPHHSGTGEALPSNTKVAALQVQIDAALEAGDIAKAAQLDAAKQALELAEIDARKALADTGVTDWPELVPLPEDTGDTSPPQPFPFAALGPLLGAAAQAIAEDVQAPDAMAGGSVLAAASLAAQPLADVVLPHGKACPLTLYLVSSGSSGDRKSAVDDVACME